MTDWKHQAHEFQIGREKKSRAQLWPMRSGKSKGVIDKACYQYTRKTIEGAIIIAPNGVHLNWVLNEIPKWSWPKIGPFKSFAWITPKRGDFEQIKKLDGMLAHGGMKWLTVNKEALRHPDFQRAVRKFILSCHRKFMLIVDESHHFGRPGAKRTRLARGLSKLALLRQILTGTLILNSPLRAFSQFELLQEGALGFDNYKDFKERYAITELRSIPNRRRKREVIVGYQFMDELRAKIAKWSSVVLREDIHDMPALLQTERPVVMSEKQRREYLKMVSHHLVEIERHTTITKKDGGARVQTLHQIIMGYMLDPAGAIVPIDDEKHHALETLYPVYEALLEQVGGTLPGKSIVWCRFREDVRRALKVLRAHGYECLEYHGGVPAEEREPTRLEFQNNPKKLVIVGTLGTGGEGLDFSAADAVIFLSVTPNTVQVKQGEERATMVGGKSVSVVRITVPGTVVDRLWNIIDGNVSLADTVSGRGLRDLLRETDI